MSELSEMQRPALLEGGHVLVVSVGYPPLPGGSTILMRNLLARFDPASFTVVTGHSDGPIPGEGVEGVVVHRYIAPLKFSARLDRLWRDWQLPRATAQITRLVQRLCPQVIVGVYPDYHFLYAAREAARRTRTPWLAYLHDTVAEGLASSHLASKAARLQEQVFQEASRLLVMSEGMADLYQSKYGVSSRPLEHTYAEAIPAAPPEEPPLRQAFWGGAVYKINARAVARVAAALGRLDCPLTIAAKTTPSQLEGLGVSGAHVKIDFFPHRGPYLEALRRQGLLVLALDWPDESPMHEDELATIFPTKTPEYLATGRPILAHCPEHYFLARFIRERGCGVVVTERSVDAVAQAAERLLANPPEARGMGCAALQAAHLFTAERVAAAFQEEVRRTARATWGQPVE